jgi:hypothetical protein
LLYLLYFVRLCNLEQSIEEGGNNEKVANNTSDEAFPTINDKGQLAWTGNDGLDDEIFLFDGTSTIQLTNNSFNDGGVFGIQMNDNGAIVWHGEDGSDREIFLATPPPNGGCMASAVPSTLGASPVYGPSDLGKHIAFLLLPIGAVIGLGGWRRKR